MAEHNNNINNGINNGNNSGINNRNNNGNIANGNNTRNDRNNYTVSHVTSSPFWIITILIAFVGWLASIVGAGILKAANHTFWELVFQIVLIFALVFLLLSNGINHHRLALMTFCAIAFVYATYNGEYIYNDSGSGKAAGAGSIILAFVFGLWILALGIEEGSVLSNTFVYMGVQPGRSTMGTYGTAAPAIAQVPRNAQPETTTAPTAHPFRLDMSPDAEYTGKVQALYSYTASLEDPNELSFTKGEVLDTVSSQGKWWQAKKQDGSIGIVPSNYFKQL